MVIFFIAVCNINCNVDNDNDNVNDDDDAMMMIPMMITIISVLRPITKK
jgi:hypothetical protein